MDRSVALVELLEVFYIALCVWVLTAWLRSIYKAAIARQLAGTVLTSIDKSVGSCSGSSAHSRRNAAQLLSELDRLMQDQPIRSIADLNRLAVALAAAHMLRRAENVEPSVFEATVGDLPKPERSHIQQNSAAITSTGALEDYLDAGKTGHNKIEYLSNHLNRNLIDVMEHYSDDIDEAA